MISHMEELTKREEPVNPTSHLAKQWTKLPSKKE